MSSEDSPRFRFIRLAQRSDAQALTTLADSAYSKYLSLLDEPPAPLSMDYEQIASAGQTFVLDQPEGVAGMVTVESDRPALILRNLAVSPELQSRGIGTLLAQYVEWLGDQGKYEVIRLWTRSEMTDNIRFYLALGYSITKTLEEGGASRIFFEKPLHPAHD